MIYPCHSMNNLVHRIFVMASSVPTNSDLHELRVFNFCLDNILCRVPSPIVNSAPVCDLKSGCTAKLASTYHLSTCRLSAVSVKISFLFFLRTACSVRVFPSHQQMGCAHVLIIPILLLPYPVVHVCMRKDLLLWMYENRLPFAYRFLVLHDCFRIN